MKKILLVSLVIIILATPLLGLANDVSEVPSLWDDKEDVIIFLNSLLVWVWRAMIVIVTLIFLYAGFQFVTAAGDADKIGKAKEMVKWGLVGAVVMVLAGGVVALIEALLTSTE